LLCIIAIFLFGYFYPVLTSIGELSLIITAALLVLDFVLLFSRSGVDGDRTVPKRLSNGDENAIQLRVSNSYPFKIQIGILDEIPHQFQKRDFNLDIEMEPGTSESVTYSLRPVERGEYEFGLLRLFVNSPIGFVTRRFSAAEQTVVPVYPSFIQMRKFEMYAISNRLSDIGIKKIRRIGHTMEFDQIKEYVPGNDVRSINWKATARAGDLMVNLYQDERSQQVVNVIDMGRVMKMPFNGLKLVDYAINTSLVISNIALIKEDKAGLFTFTNKKVTVVKPEKRRPHIQRIQEALYNLDTNFLESDYSRLVVNLKKHLNQRSLILLYTNFETLDALRRQLPYLQQIAKDHLLVTIFFQNTELNDVLEKQSENVSDIYKKAVAEQFELEKRQIVRDLNQRGIHTILTPPEELSVNAINKYLELKARGAI
jgi:uncharacterized protein (DUF58 family)